MHSHMLRRGIAAVSALALGAVAFVPATARATITVGSDLSLAPTSKFLTCPTPGAQCTFMGGGVGAFAAGGVHAGNAYPAKSPANGTVVAWGIRTGVSCGPVIGPCLASETVTFRLVRTVPPTNGAVGVATGPTVTLKYPYPIPSPPPAPLKYPGEYFFPGPGPAIHAGDYVGIDTSATWAVSGLGGCGYPEIFNAYQPALTNGGSPQSEAGVIDCELLVNAVVEPSSKVKFGKLTGPFKGIYFFAVQVPGPGALSLRGRGVARQASGHGVARISKAVTEAGTVKLKIKPKGSAKRVLVSTGRAKVKVKVTFAPVGGSPGTTKHKLNLRGG
jgi:hypothetical protein